MKDHTVYLLYHYFYPDDVISARLFSDIAIGLTDAGYTVVAVPSVRSCHDAAAQYPKSESWAGGKIERLWRPAWSQQSNKGRLGNMLFMLFQWTVYAMFKRRAKHETVIIGTDPIFSILMAYWWRVFRPSVQIIHWCHDVYPDAAVADGLLKKDSFALKLMNAMLKHAYRRCDAIADLGGCMRKLLQATISIQSAKPTSPQFKEAINKALPNTEVDKLEVTDRIYVTLPPWSLVESEAVKSVENEQRSEMFPSAKMGLLYSGNLGRAHLYEPFLRLSEELGTEFGFYFAGRGPQFAKLKEAAEASKSNIRFGGFASEEVLNQRLAAADVHLVSLAPSWTGSVVPSKFFGALAMGRPVLFAGTDECCLAEWINQFEIGWVLNDNNKEKVARELRSFANDEAARRELNEHCQRVYQSHFSKAVQLQRWTALVASRNIAESC